MLASLGGDSLTLLLSRPGWRNRLGTIPPYPLLQVLNLSFPALQKNTNTKPPSMGELSKGGEERKIFRFKNISTHFFSHTNLFFPFNALKKRRHLLTEHDTNRPRAITCPFNF